MVIGQKNKLNIEEYYAEFSSIPKEMTCWLEHFALENNCKIEKKEWKSKYNNYVIYDYEPFCSDGFEICITISALTKEHIKFVQYLYEKKIEQINYLTLCYEV